MKRLSRRAFLALGAGAGAAAIGALVWRDRSPSTEAPEGADELRNRLAGFLSDPAGTAALGALAVESVGSDIFDLAARIAPVETRDPPRWFAGVGDAGFRAHVDERARADFAAGDVVSLDGWHLSLVEAEICALWYLLT